MVAFNKEADIEGLRISPNPVTNDVVNVQFTSPAAGFSQITLLTASGQQIAQQWIQVDKGDNTYQFKNLSTLAQGSYYVNLANKETGKVHTKRIMK
jgi:hypothetical protein